jgi:hypothetical protein
MAFIVFPLALFRSKSCQMAFWDYTISAAHEAMLIESTQAKRFDKKALAGIMGSNVGKVNE